jgi:plastocyanin domain-containing protein
MWTGNGGFLAFWAVFLLMAGAPAQADTGDVTITIKDGKFAPSEVRIPANKKVRLVVRNRDATTSEFESSDFHREQIVSPGGEITVFVGPLDPGTYEFFDDFHPDNRGYLVAR